MAARRSQNAEVGDGELDRTPATASTRRTDPATDGPMGEPGLPGVPRHQVDRAMQELLQEVRVVQTGGQIFFAFLLSIAFTPRFGEATEAERVVYGCDVVALASSMALLVAPVAVHRLNFGRRIRPALLTVANALAIAGLVLLLVAIVLSVALISLVVFPESAWVLPVITGGVLLACWVVLPVVIRVVVRTRPS